MMAHLCENLIDKASIIENKDRTKIYWEQLMMAAAQQKNLSRQWSPDMRKSISSCSKNEMYICKSSNIFGVDSIEKPTGNYDADLDSDSDLLGSENQLNEKPLRDSKQFIEENLKKSFPLTMERKIALELKEMKEREEELKEWRSKIFNENCKVISLPKDVLTTNGNEELMSSLHTTDDSNYSEYGSEEKEHSLDENGRVNTPYLEFIHGRTQSMDSVSSGHSSGSGSTLNERERELLKRRVMVRPYEDPEEEEKYPCYAWDGKETPIEREIRLAREREEELRREKGTANIIENCRAFSRKIKKKYQKEIMENDPRGIQHRLATSRIQQEIEEANERERELRTEGKIISTSEETLDAKVTRLEQLIENSITENKYRDQKIKKSSGNLLSDRKFGEKTNENHGNQFSGKCKGNNLKKGVMEKFFSMKGQPFLTNSNIQSQLSDEEFQSRPINRHLPNLNGDTVVHTRKGYVSAAEKIQEELKDNKIREEELRLQRARTLARSQPNLTEIFDNEEEESVINWKSQDGGSPSPVPRLVHSVSNPNLLDDMLDKVHKRPSNKKFFLLEEWEKRIQENNQKD